MPRRHAIYALTGSALLCATLGVILLLPSCDLGRHMPPAGPHRGGSIIFAPLSDVGSLLPQFIEAGEADIGADQVIWAPLWYVDPTGVLHLGLAREIPSLANGGISPDLKTWIIRLKPHLTWSDGSPLTASDVAFSLNTYANPHFASSDFPLSDPHDPIDFLGATTLDPTTVQFTIAHPNVTLLAHLEEGFQGPIPEEVFGTMKPGDIPKSSQVFLPKVVSGPFIPKEHVQGDHLTVVRNPYYYQAAQGLPYLDQITFKVLADQSTILHALRAGQVDATYTLTVTNLDSYRALSGYTTYQDKYATAGYEVLTFNLTNPILKDLAVRQALTMSLDPRQVIAQAAGEVAVPTCDDSVGTFAHEPDLTCYPQDSRRAALLLEQDGWKVGTDGYRYKGGRRLELHFSTSNVDLAPPRLKTEALAQASWGRIGIKLDIQNQPPDQFFGPTMTNGTFDIIEFFNDFPTYDPDDHWTFMCNQTPQQGGSNFGHYCNPVVDQLETQQQVTADISARQAAFHSIHLAILADLPVMYLYIPRLTGVYRTTLHNYVPAGLNHAMWNVWEWYLSAT